MWTPRQAKSAWREYLTPMEAADLDDALAESAAAKKALAEATARINPIRMRACQRALYDQRRQANADTVPDTDEVGA